MCVSGLIFGLIGRGNRSESLALMKWFLGSWVVRMKGDSSELLPHFSFLIGRVPMATESEAGGKLPPGVGILTKDVVKTRPDLSDMEGFTVRVPRSLDIDTTRHRSE